jgi:hypothetical protein
MIEADLAAAGQATAGIRDDMIDDCEQPSRKLRPDDIRTPRSVDTEKDILSEVVCVACASHQVSYNTTNMIFVPLNQFVKRLLRARSHLEH